MGGKQYKCSNFHTKVLISSANNYCPFGEQLLAFFEANLANNVFSPQNALRFVSKGFFGFEEETPSHGSPGYQATQLSITTWV